MARSRLKAKRRKQMAQLLARVLKEDGKLGEFMEHEAPHRAGREIQKLIAEGARAESQKDKDDD